MGTRFVPRIEDKLFVSNLCVPHQKRSIPYNVQNIPLRLYIHIHFFNEIKSFEILFHIDAIAFPAGLSG